MWYLLFTFRTISSRFVVYVCIRYVLFLACSPRTQRLPVYVLQFLYSHHLFRSGQPSTLRQMLHSLSVDVS
uniref:Putative secreted protein n=1 Tax=Anopheles darlingi TaxID=43151 RepID=A0A2M4DC04_ANODA